MTPTRRPQATTELTPEQKRYFLSDLYGMAFWLPSETVYDESDHPFGGYTDEEVEAIWREHRDELLVGWEHPHGRRPWPDVQFEIGKDDDEDGGTV